MAYDNYGDNGYGIPESVDYDNGGGSPVPVHTVEPLPPSMDEAATPYGAASSASPSAAEANKTASEDSKQKVDWEKAAATAGQIFSTISSVTGGSKAEKPPAKKQQRFQPSAASGAVAASTTNWWLLGAAAVVIVVAAGGGYYYITRRSS